jgi:multidrug efflux pump subunit AcrA (membrane-fusion protein)
MSATTGHGTSAPWVLAGGALALALLSTLTSGCGHTSAQTGGAASSVSSVPEVHVVKIELRNLTCKVDQPGFVEAFEQTAIYSKVSGFIKKYYVDIGDHVKKDGLIVEIDVPELDEEHQQKAAQVDFDRKMVVVARSKLQTAIAQLTEAKANVERYEADIVRWESEVRRLTQMVEQRVVDREVLDETQKQLASSVATRDAARAAVAARDAERVSAEADVETAKAQVKVAEADERSAAAMLAYTKVTAPYDGVITVRNANTGDYVQAATGDTTGEKSTARVSPMFVIARDDLVRIFVEVPEDYARYVQEGTKAAVRVGALSGLEIKAAVTRTSWSLTEKTRTLSAEIDLDPKDPDVPIKALDPLAKNLVPANTNPDPPAKSDDGLRPGNYVKTTVIIERPHVPVLPKEALVVSGNETYCFLLRDGKAVKTSLVRGLRDGAWVEVTKMRIGDRWVNVTGGEEVIMGALDELTDGQTVNVVQKPAP